MDHENLIWMVGEMWLYKTNKEITEEEWWTDIKLGSIERMIFIEALKVNTTITELNMEGCKMQMIWERKGNRTHVWMTDNMVREHGAKAMSEMLKVNTTLTSLDMRCKEKKDW